MNRAELVEKAATALHRDRLEGLGAVGNFGEPDGLDEQLARVVLDAVLPQITTAEEFHALPLGTKLITVGGDYVDRFDHQFEAIDIKARSRSYAPVADSQLARFLPLTVVWQPQDTP